MGRAIVSLEKTKTLTNLIPLAYAVDSLCARNQEGNNVDSGAERNSFGGQELRRTSAQVCFPSSFGKLGTSGGMPSCS